MNAKQHTNERKTEILFSAKTERALTHKETIVF